jgi:hypothetical protein
MEVKHMWLFKFLDGVAFGAVAGCVINTITCGGGVIVGRENVRNAVR